MHEAALKNTDHAPRQGTIPVVTPYHAKYYAHELTAKKSSDMVDRLTYSLVEAAVDLNPHQIEAALFALRSPLSKGVILADEVGLGKTIEAGLLLCQFWAEHKRRLLIICPASLRRQWSIEMEEKFGIPSIILENKSYTQMDKDGQDPLMQDRAIIMSYHFAARLKDQMRGVNWDLVVIDEAHKLRNLYKKDNKMGKIIYEALGDKRKVLLTATPLQNSLMELFGLAMLVDDRIFGSEEAFKDNYINGRPNLAELQSRLKPFVHRTLRRDVLEYIKYTNREAITVPFTPNEKEQQLYDLISDFVLRQDCYSIPTAQRKLVVLVIRKLLSSSTYAIIGTLKTIKQRLVDLQTGQKAEHNVAGQISHENDLGSEYDEEAESLPEKPRILDQDVDEEKLRREIAEIDHYIEIARSITVETKAVKLLHALETGFKRMQDLGAQDKAIIFTESNRTQRYIKEYLGKNPEYKGKIVTFNGQNNDDLARSIYQQWFTENEDTGRITGTRDVDMRQALVDHFKNHGRVMIATEAAAEGMNLQFCSLLVNYDLPWNPQRVEQRIGRCHRYGQKHDVVVINFLNETNWADQRIYELLRYKFKLFDGVFGASDEVLGRIEDGIDFEKRISDIFDTCRTQEEIETAFASLQEELEEPITEKLSEARQVLFEHFDEDVHGRLRLHKEQAIARRDEMLDAFWHLTKYILIHHHAEQFIGQYHFDDERRMFGTPSSKRKKDRVYRYYVSIQAIKNGAESCPVKTVPAQALEEIVLAWVRKILSAPEWIKKLAETAGQELKLPDINACLERFDAVWDELFPVEQARIVHLLVEKVTVRPDGITLKLRPAGFVSVLQDIRPDLDLDQRAKATTDTPLVIDIPAILRRQAGRKFIKAPDGSDLATSERPRYDDALIKAVVRAHDWRGRLDSGKARSVREIGEAEGLGETYVRNIVRLTELAPDITAAILNGRQPSSLTLSQIRAVPLLWDDQRRAFGFTA